ncbi:hypothetical protein DIC66_11525 [Rhodoferax lacus]|uniref:DUF4148 domain-containing protein n=1 Tax=Rhodoferax lacus TaxID=2184758 RepID=A0A3E1RBB5_9BURK|nr:DUF4148 domain-containing protein [Rhodoferax lacus]RFO96647.1 hypothetical protein DIC66_11525 [Rhodoferax lacus]
MKNSQKIILTLAAFTFSSMAAMASDHESGAQNRFMDAQSSTSLISSKTREEVLAELVEAQRTGDIVASNGQEDSGKKLNELYPERYPAKATTAGRTRQQVLDELAEAQRTGDIVAGNGHEDSGKKLNELYPERYPAKAAVAGKTRQQVLDELAEAQRLSQATSGFTDQIFN